MDADRAPQLKAVVMRLRYQDYDYKITFIAEKFEGFILGLQSADEFESVER